MLLGRLVHFAAQRNWAGVAIELLIVVVGVFLGLQAQDWNQRRIDREKEEAYSKRLTADFSFIANDLERCMKVYRTSLEAIEVVARRVQPAAAEPERSQPRPLSEALIHMTAGSIPAGRSATFVEMLSTGDLGLLRDPSLRDALVAYDEDSQVNREIWRSIRDEVSAYGHPLHENIRLSVDVNTVPMSSIDAYDLDEMANDPRFRAMLNVFAGAKANLYELCKTQHRRAERVQESLRKSAPGPGG